MNLKAYAERLNALSDEMNRILESADTQTRAMTEQESADYNAKREEYDSLKQTYETMCAAHTRAIETVPKDAHSNGELADFEAYIRSMGRTQNRAMQSTDNGAISPVTIGNMIVTKIKEISPLVAGVTVFTAKGELTIPQFGISGGDIEFSYVDEGAAIPESTAKFTKVSLKNNMFSTMIKISEKMLSDTDFDVVGYIVDYTAQKLAEFLEYTLLNGAKDSSSTVKSVGALSAANVLTTASATAITADELIDLQYEIPATYRTKAMFILNKASMKAVRKLKDNNGNYLFTTNNAGSMPELLGIPAHVSENMPAGYAALLLDPSGMGLKIARGVEIRILDQLYAGENMVGIRAGIHMDSNIIDQQKIAVLKYKA